MILVLYSLFLFPHPLHVSVSEINYSEKDKALQITSRIFVDDLELSIRNQRKEPELDLLLPKNGLTTDLLVSEYLKDHVRFTTQPMDEPVYSPRSVSVDENLCVGVAAE